MSISINVLYNLLPERTLRVKGVTHSNIDAIKYVELFDSIDDVLDHIIREYIDSHREKESILEKIEQNNMLKIGKILNKKKENQSQKIGSQNKYKTKDKLGFYSTKSD